MAQVTVGCVISESNWVRDMNVGLSNLQQNKFRWWLVVLQSGGMVSCSWWCPAGLCSLSSPWQLNKLNLLMETIRYSWKLVSKIVCGLNLGLLCQKTFLYIPTDHSTTKNGFWPNILWFRINWRMHVWVLLGMTDKWYYKANYTIRQHSNKHQLKPS